MIYDCFIFFNELDLLEIRLNVLNRAVDKFVLVEATHTHQYKSKPLHYADHKERFQDFHDKIIHVVVDDLPRRHKSSWDMENHQRNSIARGLTNCKPDDTIIVSDLDEIPDPKKITEFYRKRGLWVFQQKNFYYFLNCIAVSEEWYGTVMGHFSDLSSPQGFRSVSKEMHANHKKILKNSVFRFFRTLRNPLLKKDVSIIEDAGWHFGYLGNVDHAIAKIEAMAHGEYNKAEFKDKETMLHNMINGKDLFGRDLEYKFIEIDNSFPEYILLQKGRFKDLIKYQ